MIESTPPTDTDTTRKIKSRGMLRVCIRPSSFDQERIKDYSSLPQLIEKASVKLRGWDFPHIDSQRQSHMESDWIRQEVSWDGIIESWHFFQSGQFLFLGGIREDWRDESSFLPSYEGWTPGKLLNVHETIFRFIEIFEFAARLVKGLPGDDPISVSIGMYKLSGRQLYMGLESRRHMRSEWYVSAMPEFKWSEEIQRSDILANSREIAARVSVELFKRFKWEQPEKVVKEIQDELRSR
jgi:hypothetical protein